MSRRSTSTRRAMLAGAGALVSGCSGVRIVIEFGDGDAPVPAMASGPPAPDAPDPVPAPPQAPLWLGDVGWITAMGVVTPMADRMAKGFLSVSRKKSRWQVNFAADFEMSTAKDIDIAFGDGSYREGARIARLNHPAGAQNYAVPGALDVGRYLQVWLWDTAAKRPAAMAQLALI